MCNRVLLLFGKLTQRNLHVNCQVNGTTFQSGLKFQTGLISLRVSCKRVLKGCEIRLHYLHYAEMLQDEQDVGKEETDFRKKICYLGRIF